MNLSSENTQEPISPRNWREGGRGMQGEEKYEIAVSSLRAS